MSVKLPKVSIIGAGCLGGALTLALAEKGYKIASIIDINGSKALSLSKSVRCEKAGNVVADIAATSEIIFITVNDSQIATVSSEISKQKHLYLRKMLTVHCSGVFSADILDPLRKKGAVVGTMHPIQTFPPFQTPSKLKAKFRGTHFGIDGSEEALKRIEQIITTLGGKWLVIPKDLKPLYHIACVFASNYEMIFLNTISELSQLLRLPVSWMEAFGPLMTASMENMVKHGAGKALTGPIVRGDFETIDLHLKTLDRHAAQFLPLYTVGGIEAARIAKESGRLSEEDFNEIILKFRKFIQSSSMKKITRGKK